MNATLTPGDIGILAANLDYAIAVGMGDDDIVQYLRKVIIWEGMPTNNPESTAYRFYQDTLNRKEA